MHCRHLLPKRDVSSIMLDYEFREQGFCDSKLGLISKIVCNINDYSVIKVESNDRLEIPKLENTVCVGAAFPLNIGELAAMGHDLQMKSLMVSFHFCSSTELTAFMKSR